MKKHHTTGNRLEGTPETSFVMPTPPARALTHALAQHGLGKSFLEEAVMFLDSVLKLNVVGVLAVVLAIPAGCSDARFEGCEASRTCPPKGGESGSGSGGESGVGNGGEAGETNTGGRPNGSGGGSAGVDDNPGGEGGTGGTGEDREPPTVISFAPAHGDEDVERDVRITVTFSEPIDERSVTTTSFVLTGPEGEVPGALSVDGEVVSFVPNRKLWLLGDYVLTVGETVADLAGNELGQVDDTEFRVRDGRWSAPTYPFGATSSLYVHGVQRNSAGDMVLGMGTSLGAAGLFGGVYRVADERWTSATSLMGTTGAFFLGFGIDDVGRAVAGWSTTGVHGWLRTVDGDTWIDAGPLESIETVAVTSTGLATAAWRTSTGIGTRTIDLDDGSLRGSGSIERNDVIAGPRLFSSLDRTALLVTTGSSTGGNLLWVSWRNGSIWTQPEQLASAPQIGDVAFDSDENGDVIVLWSDYGRIWSRVYQRSTASWTDEDFVRTIAPNPGIDSVDMTNGRALVLFQDADPDPSGWGAVYETGKGWVDSSVVRLGERASVAALDDAGNGLATWANAGSSVQVRRYLTGTGWLEHVSLSEAVANIWAVAATDRSIGLVSYVGTGMDATPWTIRFE